MCSAALQKKNIHKSLRGNFYEAKPDSAADDPADETWLSCHYWLNIREDPVGGGYSGAVNPAALLKAC